MLRGQNYYPEIGEKTVRETVCIMMQMAIELNVVVMNVIIYFAVLQRRRNWIAGIAQKRIVCEM